MLLLWLAACGDCAIDAPLDYTPAEAWLCRPGDQGACPATRTVQTVAEDGSLTERTLVRAEAPAVACFAVYPTLDLRLRVDLHHDTDDLEAPAAWARDQLAQLAPVCDLWVPIYRQVTIGTYIGRLSMNKQTCHVSAFADVDAAFDAFLSANPGRPFALVGHSQGAHRLSELIRTRIDPDPDLRDRLVAAYPIGWPIGTDAGGSIGGSFESVPICQVGQQTGCALGWRAVIDDDRLEQTGPYGEGELVCTNPASPDAPRARGTLAAFTMAGTSPVLDRLPFGADPDALLEWPDAFDAVCRDDAVRGLEVTWIRRDRPPVDLDGADVSLINGAHILDLNLGSADLAADLARRAEAWNSAR